MPIDPLTGELVPEDEEELKRKRRGTDPLPVGSAEEGSNVTLIDRAPLVDDLLLAVPRAAEGLVRGVGELVDLAAPVLGFDQTNLTQGSRLFGRPRTLVGGLATTALQFAAPFSLGFKLTKGLALVGSTGAQFASEAAAANAARAGLSAGLTGFGRGVAAGAVADFITFGGQEERLSNLLAKIPGAQQPIFEFLQSDESDSEFAGRLKNVLEGVGAGAVFDLVFGAAKGLKAARKFALDNPKKASQILDKTIKEVGPEAAQLTRTVTLDGKKRSDLFSEKPKERVRKQRKKAKPRSRKKRKQQERTKARRDRLTAKQAADRGIDPTDALVDSLGLDKNLVDQAAARFDSQVAAHGIQLMKRLGGNPRKMTKKAKALFQIAQDGVNLSNLAEATGTEDAVTMVRVLEKMLEESGAGFTRTKKTEGEILANAASTYHDLINGGKAGPSEMAKTVQSLDAMVGSAKELERTVVATNMALVGHQEYLSDLYLIRQQLLDETRPAQISPEELAGVGLKTGSLEEVEDKLLNGLALQAKFADSLNSAASSTGRTLRSRQIPFNADVLDLLAGPEEGMAKRIKDRMGEADFKRLIGAAEVAARERKGLTGASALTRFAEMTGLQKASAISQELVIHSLLNSGTTVTTNGIFPFFMSYWSRFQRIAGAGVATAFGQGHKVEGVIADQLAAMGGMISSLSEAARAASDAFRTGVSRVDPIAAKFGGDSEKLVSSQVLGEILGEGFGPHTVAGHAIDHFSKFNSLGARGIAAADSFNKVMVGLGVAKAKLQKMALARGEDVASFVQEGLDKLYRNGQFLTEERILQESERALDRLGLKGAQRRKAKPKIIDEIKKNSNFDELNPVTVDMLREGRDATVSGPFDQEHDRVFIKIQELLDGIPFMRVIFPFFKTPIKLLQQGLRSSPVDPLLSVPSALLNHIRGNGVEALENSRLTTLRDFASKDPERVAAAVGRWTTGLGIAAAAFGAADAGIITGHGPSDPERRRLLLNAGWLPYSIQVPGGYVQYLRADPWSIQIGLAADLLETARLTNEVEDQDGFTSAVIGITNSISNNLTNRTYLVGMSQLIGALTDGERNAAPFLAGVGRSFVPRLFTDFGNFISDPVLKDTHGILNRLRKNIPFFGEPVGGVGGEVPPFRNVLGEKVKKVSKLSPAAFGIGEVDTPANLLFDFVMPVAYREVTDDVIKREFATLQHGFSPPRRTKFGVKLDSFTRRGQSAYDRWLELHGEVKIRGRSLRQEMKRLIGSAKYQQLPIGGSVSNPSPRVRLLRSVIERYRARALSAMLDEFPDARRAMGINQRDQQRIRAGLAVDSLTNIVPPFEAFLSN